jgi:hypothetical protein
MLLFVVSPFFIGFLFLIILSPYSHKRGIMAIAVNILRRNGYSSITRAQRFIAHDLDKIFSLVE